MHGLPYWTGFHVRVVERLDQLIARTFKCFPFDQKATQPIDVQAESSLGHQGNPTEVGKGILVSKRNFSSLLDATP
jgi:hypothetical protein